MKTRIFVSITSFSEIFCSVHVDTLVQANALNLVYVLMLPHRMECYLSFTLATRKGNTRRYNDA